MLKPLHAIALFVTIFAATFLLIDKATAGERVAANPFGDQGRFTELPCTNPDVLKHLNPQVASKLRAAVMTVQGHIYQACYIESDGTFVMVYEDGDFGEMSTADLLPDS